MPFDKNGDWHEERPVDTDNDWGESWESTTGNLWFVLKWFAIIILTVAMGILSWFLKRELHYEWFYKDRVEQEIEKRMSDEQYKLDSKNR